MNKRPIPLYLDLSKITQALLFDLLREQKLHSGSPIVALGRLVMTENIFFNKKQEWDT